MKIVILEDDLLLASLIEEHLQEKGYEPILFYDGDEAFEYLYDNSVDLILLDINVPGIKGDEILQNLRNNNITTPVIFITSYNSSQDVKQGFALGCDDYIKKPFEFDELDARMEHIIKIYNLNKSTIPIGPYEFDPQKNILIKEDKIYHLSQKLSQILFYFVQNPNRLITKEELIQNIWEDIPTDATIRTYIKMLRDYFPNIQTIRGVGYEFKPL